MNWVVNKNSPNRTTFSGQSTLSVTHNASSKIMVFRTTFGPRLQASSFNFQVLDFPTFHKSKSDNRQTSKLWPSRCLIWSANVSLISYPYLRPQLDLSLWGLGRTGLSGISTRMSSPWRRLSSSHNGTESETAAWVETWSFVRWLGPFAIVLRWQSRVADQFIWVRSNMLQKKIYFFAGNLTSQLLLTSAWEACEYVYNSIIT